MASAKTFALLCLLALASTSGAFAARRLLQTSSGTVRWLVPEDNRLAGRSVPVGGSLNFQWTGTHDVWEVPSSACPESFVNGTNIRQLAPQSAGGNLTVEFPTAGVRYFACSVSDHCEEGQHITVTVGGAPAPAPSRDDDDEEGYGGGYGNAPSSYGGGGGSEYGGGGGSEYGGGGSSEYGSG